MFTLKSYIEERVPAWEECVRCQGSGNCWSVREREFSATKGSEMIGNCNDCNGSGGTWHEAVYFNNISKAHFVDIGEQVSIMNERYTRVTKSSFLVRRWGVCCKSELNEDTEDPFYAERCKHGQIFKRDEIYPDSWIHIKECAHCEGTGAEPGTAGEWEVLCG